MGFSGKIGKDSWRVETKTLKTVISYRSEDKIKRNCTQLADKSEANFYLIWKTDIDSIQSTRTARVATVGYELFCVFSFYNF